MFVKKWIAVGARACAHMCVHMCTFKYGGTSVPVMFLCLNVCSHRYPIHQALRCSPEWVGFCMFLHQWHHILINSSEDTLPVFAATGLIDSYSHFLWTVLKKNLLQTSELLFLFLFLRSGEGFRFLAWLLNPQEMDTSHHFYSVFISASFHRPLSSWATWIGLPRESWPEADDHNVCVCFCVFVICTGEL